jgi:phosphotriesterase-related protein
VGFDRFGIETLLKDAERIECVWRMIEAGYVRSLCLSHDATCGAWLGRPSFDGKRALHPDRIAQILPNWEPTHLFKRILPQLRERGLTEAQVNTLLVENPRRYFEGVEPPRPE